MTVNNDKRILELKNQIEIKKEALGKSSKFSPVTNCSIEFEGERYNIQTLNKEKATELLIKLNSLRLSAIDLKLEDEYKISGYNLSDWIIDIVSRVNVLSRKDEENKLKAMESKLVKLLSDGKKVELEIDEIESLLKS